MPIVVVLADGFDGHDVELVVEGVPYVVEDVTTSLLDGVAAKVDVDAEGPAEVSARIVKGHGARADPQPDDVLPDDDGDVVPEPDSIAPLALFTVPEDATLVLSYDERGLTGVVHTEAVAFD